LLIHLKFGLNKFFKEENPMIELDSSTNLGANIKVCGIGGGGGNVINTMVNEGLEGVEFISANTDIQSLSNNLAPIKIQLGKELTKGLGAGSNPETGSQAAIESKQEIAEIIKGADMLFLTAGMGGGTGTGGAPIISQIAKELGILTVGIVTKPFAFEGRRRMKKALEGIGSLKDCVDTLITIPNQKLLSLSTPNTTMKDAFGMADQVLLNAVQGISDIINLRGEINVDFADVKTIMSEQGMALMGIGVASGENRAIEAASQAISSPLLEEMAIDGAMGILINITGSSSMTLMEINEAAMFVEEKAHEDANIIFGSAFDDTLEDKIRVTVIATGFDTKDPTTVGTDDPIKTAISSDQTTKQETHPLITDPKLFETMKLFEPRESKEISKPIELYSQNADNPSTEQTFSIENPTEQLTLEEVSQELKVEEEVSQELKVEEEVPQELKVEEEVPQELKVEEEVPQELKVEEEVPQELKVKEKREIIFSTPTEPPLQVRAESIENDLPSEGIKTSELKSTMDLIHQRKIPVDKILGNEELDIPTFLRKSGPEENRE